jgi:undecaprenyl-diphosphatase
MNRFTEQPTIQSDVNEFTRSQGPLHCYDGAVQHAVLPRIRICRWRATSIAALVAVLVLAAYVSLTGQAAWEAQLMRWQQANSPRPLPWLAEALTWLGNSTPTLVIATTAGLLLLGARHRLLAALLVGAVALRALSPLMKDLIERPRPSPELVDVANQLSTPSFPSGHVLGATLLYGFLVYAAECAIVNERVRRVVQAGCVSMMLLMGYARVELGEHWPTDVLGGWLIGLLMVMALAWVHRRSRSRYVGEPVRIDF